MSLSFRHRLALSLLVLIPLGFGTKLYGGPGVVWIRGHAGGVLYVTFWVVGVLFVVPSLSPWTVACGVFLGTCGLEFLQLWSVPILRPIRETFLGHALLGSTFDRWDFLHYGIGAACGLVLVRTLHPRTPSS